MRLKPEFVKTFNNDPTTSKIFNNEIDQYSIFEQVPIVISNSHFYRAFIRGLSIPKVGSIPIGLPIGSMFSKTSSYIDSCVATQPTKRSQKANHSINCLGSESEEFLEKHLEYLTEIIEEHNNETWRWHCWLKSFIREKHQLALSSTNKQSYGPSSLSNLHKMTNKQIQEHYPALAKLLSSEPSRLECLVMSNQADTCCKQITKLAGFSITNLYLSHNFISQQPK